LGKLVIHKENHAFQIDHPARCSVIWCFVPTSPFINMYVFLKASPSSQQLALFPLNDEWLCVLHECLCSLPGVCETLLGPDLCICMHMLMLAHPGRPNYNKLK